MRLTGQDSQRGTFSQRHLVLHDPHTEETYTPMQHLDDATASFEVYNSPLSEYACMGFEYGYSAAAPEALVLWEAQYGDFANGAQIVIDQFVSSGRAKWRETSRLTLLLPHGYEGNGPEHSSARLERFLQLGAQENLRVVNCTTAAQYFHLLRRQALDPIARPLVVMTPKGLLRLKDAASSLADLAEGGFRPVLDDATADKWNVRRLVLCTGKVYFDIIGHKLYADASGVAVARIEQLYPFPTEATRELIASYPSLDEVVWAQEEPQNMGAWRSSRHRLEEASGSVSLRYVGRPWRASPSEGYPTAHLVAQDRIARDVLTLVMGYPRRFFFCAVHTSRATRGPWWRAWSATHRRWVGGSRRHRSNNVSAAPTGPARRVAALKKPGIQLSVPCPGRGRGHYHFFTDRLDSRPGEIWRQSRRITCRLRLRRNLLE